MDTRPPPSAVVLAAGEGRRMGGAKALLVVDGVPLVRRHLQRLHEAGCRSLAVVVPPAVAPVVGQLVQALPLASCIHVVPASTDTQAASLAAGLRALFARGALGSEAREATVLVTPVDLLPPKVETIHALLAALQGDVLAASPRHRGRGGHPVAVRGALLAPYLPDGAPTESPREPPPLREVLEGAGHRRVRVEVDDASIHGDLDTPADVRAAAEGAWPVFLARDVP